MRLRDLGLDDFLIAATLRGVIAQRLLRRLCIECRNPRAPEPSELAYFSRHRLEHPQQVYDAVGCAACNATGYAGRVGIFEMIEIDAPLRAAIDRGANESELMELALNAGETLIGQGLAEVRAGRTTLAETLRVVGDVA